jgi:hypothetical protein
MTKQVQLLALVTALVLLALVGFTVGSPPPRLGTYTMSIAAEDIPSNVPVEARNNFVGEWQMTFAKEDQYQISKDNKVLVEGHFTFSNEQIKFKDERGALACTQEPEVENGAYAWSYQDESLTFKLVEDKCEGRRFVLTIHSWLKESPNQAPGIQTPPPTPHPTLIEDPARYVSWMEKQGKPITDKPHEDVSLRIGDWGFFYHGDRPVGSWTPLRDRVAIDCDGHALTEAENSDWYAFLSTRSLDAAGALKRIAWLFNAGGLDPATGPRGTPNKITVPTLIAKDGSIRFQGWWTAYSDPPYSRRITIATTATTTKLVIDR